MQDLNDFRNVVSAFVAQALPADIRRRVLAHEVLRKDDHVRWQRILAQRGWLGWSWPREFGGTGWDAARMDAFEQACWLGGAPEVFAFGVKMLAPVLMKHGSAEQQRLHLPRILADEDWWCQGYSEPGAGSDLASLRTRAEVVGDELVIDGQKTWTSYAHWANRMFCLVRTDPTAKPQQGISFVLLDMASAGITVRPIALLDGGHEVNEVFFDQVRVPLANVVGGLNQGWTVAKALLGHERFNVGKIGRLKRELRLLKELATLPPADGGARLDDDRFAAEVADFEVGILALETTMRRLVECAARGQAVGAEASVLKLHGTALAQQASWLLMQTQGDRTHAWADAGEPSARPLPQALLAQYLNWRKLTIYGGSDEVQRNIIARTALGLP